MQTKEELEIEEIKKQNKDEETHKPRKFILELTDEQYRRLHKKAEEYNITASQLLSSFIGDLVDYHRNGADETELANNWIERAIESKRRF